jgi:hypothetical protein
MKMSTTDRLTVEDTARMRAFNETELLEMIKKCGIGRVRRGLPRDVLEGILAGRVAVTADHISQTTETRFRLQKHIEENWARARSQLPGCDGHCTTWPCTEGQHAACFGVNEDLL